MGRQEEAPELAVMNRLPKHHDSATLFPVAAHSREAHKKKKRPHQCGLVLTSPLRCYRVVRGWRSLRFFRNAMIGFPHRVQN